MGFADGRKNKAKAYLRKNYIQGKDCTKFTQSLKNVQASTNFKTSFLLLSKTKKKSQSMYFYAVRSQHLLLGVIATNAERLITSNLIQE